MYFGLNENWTIDDKLELFMKERSDYVPGLSFKALIWTDRRLQIIMQVQIIKYQVW